ncbi:MAG TPA: Zn-ribbon domain-containing OB-fold protein [Azospirillum sp.]|nr:Zn-ribbon domain-containing OB-fold protein [Azospirillum sp.]
MSEDRISKPLPPDSPATRPFWTAAAEGHFVVQRCTVCGHLRFPPGPACTRCLSPDMEWVPLSGRGTVLSHLVFHQAYSKAWAAEVPYSVVMVQLDEGPRLFSDVVDPERAFIEADLVGRRVEAVFDRVAEDMAVPRFRVMDE